MFAAESPEVREEVAPGLSRRARGKVAGVKGRSDPHVVHEKGEADHHTAYSNGTAELSFAAVVDAMVFLLL